MKDYQYLRKEYLGALVPVPVQVHLTRKEIRRLDLAFNAVSNDDNYIVSNMRDRLYGSLVARKVR
jgi:hypothetical protein